MQKRLGLLFLFSLPLFGAEPQAKNVILFLGDAGGISTLNAAGVYGHGKPQSLFIQHLDHFALSDTSALDAWVTDSAAGMTAIVTGHKTNNGMLSVLPTTDGVGLAPVKTILEYAEEKGLATGVITNMAVWDATPAACFAHVGSRKSTTEVFEALLHPRFGDGVDVLIGADKKGIVDAATQLGLEADAALQGAGYQVLNSPDAITPEHNRVAAIYDGVDFDPEPVVSNVLKILSRKPEGFFLMVEWDMHTEHWEKGLKRVLVMDALIKRVAGEAPADTLILFAADHSFDLRLRGGKKSSPLIDQINAAPPDSPIQLRPVLRVDGGHTGEEILVAAKGPGSERVHGFIPNTEIFRIMMSAYGWSETP
ncbi:MAG: alkaline phosphatase [Opitutus sp.]